MDFPISPWDFGVFWGASSRRPGGMDYNDIQSQKILGEAERSEWIASNGIGHGQYIFVYYI